MNWCKLSWTPAQCERLDGMSTLYEEVLTYCSGEGQDKEILAEKMFCEVNLSVAVDPVLV